VNRAAHFVDDRLLGGTTGLKDRYTVSLWIWNGMPSQARDIAGWFFSRGEDGVLDERGCHLGIGGTSGHTGKLILLNGSGTAVTGGRTEISRWQWNHVALVRDGDRVRVYLNGAETPEIDCEAPANFATQPQSLFFGGRCDNSSNWEGRLDEIAIFDRVLTPAELTAFSGTKP
jgi:hypothetical protein